jgi:hypothetical protein
MHLPHSKYISHPIIGPLSARLAALEREIFVSAAGNGGTPCIQDLYAVWKGWGN